MIEVRILQPGEEAVLQNVAPEVFDQPVDSRLAAEFLGDPRHHLAVALDGNRVVGFASGLTYLHPDKPLELWVNEVAVSPGYQQQGLGKRVLGALLERGRVLGCQQAWLLTDAANPAAMRLYTALGGVPSGQVLVSFAPEP